MTDNRWRWVPVVAGLGAIVTALVMVGALVWQGGYTSARIDANKSEIERQRTKTDDVVPRVMSLEGRFTSFERATAKTLDDLRSDVRDIRAAVVKGAR